jgi:hypothetical protein
MVEWQPWGACTIQLPLPSTLVVLEGLSGVQQSAICQDYASFGAAMSGTAERADVVCRAGRLARPQDLTLQRFSRNGQYAPHQRRSGDRVEITGFRFSGQLTRGGTSPATASLSVAEEAELAQSFVLENFLRILLAHRILDRGGILLHSVGVTYRGRAYLFSGQSNAGKTTLARKAAAAGARVLSDDINLLMPEQGAYRAHKVPFTGEFGRRAEKLSGMGSFPLGGLALLEKAPALTVAPVTTSAAVARLIANCPFVNDDPEELPALMDVLTRLVGETSVVRLGVARDDPFEAVVDTLFRELKHD